MDQERQERFWDLLEADQNDPDVQYALGLCYLNGDGTEPDGAEADKWLRRAAEQGQQEAQALLASSAQKPASPEDTVTEETLPDWCLRAEEGDAEAQYQTAAYFLAVSPQEGSEDAARYLAMAAEQGHPQACLLLAQQHLDRQEYAQAADLLRNAADCNLGQAAELLGECYARGQGVQQDPAEAERRFIQAAQLDGGERMVRLAVRYALGDGVAPSPGKAMNWVKKARDSGLLDAREQYDALCTAARDAAAAQQEAQAAQQAAQQAEEEARRAEALRRQEQAQAQRSEAEKAREEEAAQRRAREQAYRAQEAARIAEDKARLEAQAQAQKAKEEAQRAKEAAQKAEAARKADAIQAKRRTRASSLVYSIGSLLTAYAAYNAIFFFIVTTELDVPGWLETALTILLPQDRNAMGLVLGLLLSIAATGAHLLHYGDRRAPRLEKLAYVVMAVLLIADVVHLVSAVWESYFLIFGLIVQALLLIIYLLCNLFCYRFLMKVISSVLGALFGCAPVGPSGKQVSHDLFGL